ncbi:tyrosine-type recombinase/integrase [Paraburkholderia sp. GAS448]|uniref:tyrosine-type recombinase/integrase n=1 Tax=Paraburkholderia sp. GAS448 TaxID=3035136 RepID=UPI003D1F59EB
MRLHAIGLSPDDIVKRCRDSVVSKSMLHHARNTWKHERGSPVDKDSLTRQFMRARRQSNITWESGRTAPTFHELRSLAARLYADQEGPEFAQAIPGHKRACMTAQYRDMRGAEWTEVKFAG